MAGVGNYKQPKVCIPSWATFQGRHVSGSQGQRQKWVGWSTDCNTCTIGNLLHPLKGQFWKLHQAVLFGPQNLIMLVPTKKKGTVFLLLIQRRRSRRKC